jgi:hypothetical protein
MTQSLLRLSIIAAALSLLLAAPSSAAESKKAGPAGPVGGPAEPVRYVGTVSADTRFHDGALRPAIGVKNYQIMRANRSHPEWSDGKSWTYMHEPMMGYAHGRFYVHWFLSPKNEHEAPSHTILMSSTDGVHWEGPRVLFPVYEMADGRVALMHQRSGFYLAPNGRMLAIGFYGVAPGHNNGKGGIGRIVREIRSDNSFGPLHFIRYSTQNGWNEANTWYPLYSRSPDAGFVDACAALLKDKLHTLSWWEQDRSTDGFYTVEGGIAPSFYHRADGKVVALWKQARAALSSDEGLTWSPIVKAESLIMASGKNWGQRTADGRFAMVHNPSKDDSHRWPLALMTSDDGIQFDGMLAVHGEVPPQRFGGRHKDFGPQYVRGIAEGTGKPPGRDMWLTYSVNKEDIWVSRVPVPVRSTLSGEVRDTFETPAALDEWNLYSPRWAHVAPDLNVGPTHGSLMLSDKDPYDYAKAVRVFSEGSRVKVSLRVRPAQNTHGRLELELTDAKGQPAVRVVWADDGRVHVLDSSSADTVLVPYSAAEWMPLEIEIHGEGGRYRLASAGRTWVASAPLATPVPTIERLVLRTGVVRTEPTLKTRNYWHRKDVPNAGPETPLFWWGADVKGPDEPVREAVFHIDDVIIASNR